MSNATTLQKLTVKTVTRETNDSVVIDFDVPDDLKSDFTFKAGQYLTLQTNIDGTDVRRAYSICSAPNSGDLKVGVKHVPDGVFSTYANQNLKAGDVLEVMPPQGHFVAPDDIEEYSHFLLVCAGSGVTPILSLTHHILQANKTATVTLVYGNSYNHSIMFKDDICALKNQFLERLSIVNVLSREEQIVEIRSGRIDGEKIADIIRAFSHIPLSHAYVCGPEEIVQTVRTVCAENGLAKDCIHFELFGTADKGNKKRKASASKDKHHISIIKSGSVSSFQMDSDEKNILDMGISYGADLPFACKSGVCSTCKCMVREGKVSMDVNYGLSDEEVEQGYVLSCQSYPITQKVVMDFDV